nr:septation protein SepH [Pseudonocardia sp. HH130629-09]
MRALRVVGVTGDGSVVLEDPGRRERYTVPADEQLRAAARGDVTRLGQIAIELESQLRPREIQARIRGGASVDEVAAAAGVPTQKIERFAYPVLLERSRTAELAQSAHPQRADGPDSRTLGETVAHTFGLRGQDYAGAGWDSWKGEDGKWVVVLTWQTGRSDNAAHWAFQPGAHGGTVVALDEHASDLVEGLPARPLRPLGSVVDMARDEDHAPEAPTTAAPARAVAAAGGQQPEAWAGRGIAPEQRRASPPPPRTRVETPGRTVGTRPDDTRAPAAAAPVVPKRVEQVEATDAVNSTDATGGTGSAGATDTAQSDSARSGTARTGSVQTGSAQADDGAVSTGAPATADALPTGTTPADAGPNDTSSSGPASNGVSADGTTPGRTTSGGASSTGSDGVDPVVPAPAATATDADADATAATGRGSSATGPTHDAAATSTEAATSASGADAAGSPAPAGTSPAATAPATPEGTTAEAAPSTAGSSAAAPSTAAQSTEAQSAGTGTGSTAASTTTDDRGVATDDGSADERTEAPAAAPTETSATSPTDSAQETAPAPAQDTESAAPRRASTAGSRRTRKGKPVMPSWDEVLLGVRGQR